METNYRCSKVVRVYNIIRRLFNNGSTFLRHSNATVVKLCSCLPLQLIYFPVVQVVRPLSFQTSNHFKRVCSVSRIRFTFQTVNNSSYVLLCANRRSLEQIQNKNLNRFVSFIYSKYKDSNRILLSVLDNLINGFLHIRPLN